MFVSVVLAALMDSGNLMSWNGIFYYYGNFINLSIQTFYTFVNGFFRNFCDIWERKISVIFATFGTGKFL
jgi:hypothetical protein